mmetsp:Transcript_102113/g.289193  ORF Transcript_102113/g.289193 Transcript_102113/m.289193 type:complete len:299 (-) Transcript_102113:579-1475(-)
MLGGPRLPRRRHVPPQSGRQARGGGDAQNGAEVDDPRECRGCSPGRKRVLQRLRGGVQPDAARAAPEPVGFLAGRVREGAGPRRPPALAGPEPVLEEGQVGGLHGVRGNGQLARRAGAGCLEGRRALPGAGAHAGAPGPGPVRAPRPRRPAARHRRRSARCRHGLDQHEHRRVRVEPAQGRREVQVDQREPHGAGDRLRAHPGGRLLRAAHVHGQEAGGGSACGLQLHQGAGDRQRPLPGHGRDHGGHGVRHCAPRGHEARAGPRGAETPRARPRGRRGPGVGLRPEAEAHTGGRGPL